MFFRNRSYLEPITVVDRSAADLAAAEGQFFVKRIKRFTESRGEGFALVALKSEDAENDRAAFEKAGIAAGPTFSFARQARLPDGSEREIGFAVAYAETPAAPLATFFACQHLAPEVVFQPTYMEHRNGALGVSAVTAVAASPGEFAAFLQSALDVAELQLGDTGVEASDEAQNVRIVTPDAFQDRYGVSPPDPRRGLRFAAFEIDVENLDRAATYCGKDAKRAEARIVLPPTPGLGAVMVFHAAKNG